MYKIIKHKNYKRNEKKSTFFIKTTGFSPKHSKNIVGKTKEDNDIVKYLYSDKRCRAIIGNILIQKWKPEINGSNELRIFIENNKVKCISQQDLSKCYNNLTYFLRNNYKELMHKTKLLWSKIRKYVSYNNCVLDVYIKHTKKIYEIL
jgi:hypothetical protein